MIQSMQNYLKMKIMILMKIHIGESTAKIINQSINKNLENSKYESEKENIIAKVEMNNKNYINKDEGISNKKQNDDIYKACKYSGKMFNEIDDEIIENMDIEGCNKNK